MSPLRVRVVKVGGSLFSLPDFAPRLQAWLKHQQPAHHVLIAGGGDLADVLRGWDELHAVGEERSHWMCVRALSISASMLAALFSGALHLTQFADLQSKLQMAGKEDQGRLLVFDLHEFLLQYEPTFPPRPVPHEWSVTTDSLAARLAEVLAVDELVLLKSIPPYDAAASLTELADRGYVDKYFPNIASRLRRVSFEVI